MTRFFPSLAVLAWLLSGACGFASEFRHVGDYLLKSRMKITGEKTVPVPIKPMLLRVYTDGVEVRVTADQDEEASSTFQIYRSDGIGRQRTKGGALEIIPGLQASSNSGNVLSHIRLSREGLTITSFPGVSDQTIVSYAVGVEPISDSPATPPAKPAEKPAGGPPPAEARATPPLSATTSANR